MDKLTPHGKAVVREMRNAVCAIGIREAERRVKKRRAKALARGERMCEHFRKAPDDAWERQIQEDAQASKLAPRGGAHC